MQISWRYASFASMALLIVGTMTTVLGDQGHAASAKTTQTSGHQLGDTRRDSGVRLQGHLRHRRRGQRRGFSSPIAPGGR